MNYTTIGLGALALGCRFIGIERDASAYTPAINRIDAADRQPRLTA
jgi:hypothetical protein